MAVAGYGKLSDTFLFHRRRKTTNLIDNEIHLTAATIFISKHSAILRFWQERLFPSILRYCQEHFAILRFWQGAQINRR